METKDIILNTCISIIAIFMIAKLLMEIHRRFFDKPEECKECGHKKFTFENHYSGTVYSTYGWICKSCGKVNCIQYQHAHDSDKPHKKIGDRIHYLSWKRYEV